MPKSPVYFRPANNQPIAFAGFWDCWKGEQSPVESCTIITTCANELSRSIHERMPVMLHGADAATWLDSEIEEMRPLLAMLRPFPSEAMVGYPVSTIVNSVKNDNPLCIQPGV